ncbi:MAG: ATP-binding protein, partial [Thiomargarita sp.]|nr:ATP-binding protein [Thiomargarita sp.]
KLDYQGYRLAYRSIASSTNERTMIATILPQNVFYGHSLNANQGFLTHKISLYIVAILNSFLFDYTLRQRVSSNITIFYIYQLPIPRIIDKNIITRAAKLICTAPEYDDLAKEVGITSANGTPENQETIRAELDALVAQLYDLTVDEFKYILSTFPIVKDAVKDRALEAYVKIEEHEQK